MTTAQQQTSKPQQKTPPPAAHPDTKAAEQKPTEIAKVEAKPARQEVPTLRAFLEHHKDKIQKMAAEHMSAEKNVLRLISIAALIVHRDPKGNLQKCSQVSVLNCVQECARLGLELGGAQAHAYLVPYKDECTLSVSYRGLIALMLRSGEVKSARAHLVWPGDHFKVRLGSDPVVEHEPHLGEHDKAAQWTHVYSHILLANGEKLIDVMTRAEVMAVKGRSKASAFGPWVTDEGEMSRKTVLRRGSKYAPMAESLDESLDADAIETTAVEIHTRDVPRGNEGLEAIAQKALAAGAQPVTLETTAIRQEAVKPAAQTTQTEPPPMSDADLEAFNAGFQK